MQDDLQDNWDDDLHPEGPSRADLERFDADSNACPSCGSEIYPDTALCPACGLALGDKVDREPGKPNAWMVGIALLMIVLIAGLWRVIF